MPPKDQHHKAKNAKMEDNEAPPSLIQEIRAGFAGCNSQMGEIKQEINQFKTAHQEIVASVNFERERTNALETEVASIKASIGQQVREGVAAYLAENPVSSDSFKIELSKEIERSERNLLVFEAKDLSKDTFQNMIKGANCDSIIVEWRQLISKKGNSQTLFYKASFSSAHQRNEVLRIANSLTGVRVERDVPLAFKDCYRKFKRESYFLRSTLGVSTQLKFLGHKLLLRYKQPGPNMAYTIHKEFSPPQLYS